MSSIAINQLILNSCQLDDSVKLAYPFDFAIKLPFNTNIYATFTQYSDEWIVFVPSHVPKNPFIQATIYCDNLGDNHAELQHLRNVKNNKQLSSNGGGNILLKIWDHIAQITKIKLTKVIDMSHLSIKIHLSDEIRQHKDKIYEQISLRFLSMMTNNNYQTWYEKNGYFLENNQDQHIKHRELFFNLQSSVLLNPIKNNLLYYYKNLVDSDHCYYLLPTIIELYIDCYYNQHLNIKDYMLHLWSTNKLQYSVIEKIIFHSNNTTIQKCISIIHNEEDYLMKIHCLPIERELPPLK